MSMEIMTIQNVHAYIDAQGTAWLNAEDVARGLGFTETAASGNITIRWRTVRNYLDSFGYKPVAGSCDEINAGSYIPENMFYRLAMKASNAAAEKFQALVADEILPTLRKHGVYATGDFLTKSIADPAWAIGVLTELKAKQEEAAVLQVQLAEAKPKVDYCDSILQCPDLVTTSTIAKDYGMSAKAFNKLLQSLKVQFKQGNTWLPYQKYAKLGWTQSKTYPYVGYAGEDRCNVHTYWTQKGRLGLYHLLKENGYLPMIEQAA